MKIGKKIEKILEESGITQRELANKINLDETILSRIIKGERNPKAEVLANIATALHVTSDYLLDIDDDSEFDCTKAVRLIARNSSKLTQEDKKELINILVK
jgi:transcriptional regulator with XRE-family HTH domain